MSFEHQALPSPYLAPGSSSFAEFLASMGQLPITPAGEGAAADIAAPHGTTIVALRGSFGAVMAGDRRATMGNVIAQRENVERRPARSEDVEDAQIVPAPAESRGALDADVDAILDEIDEVLEENAEDFVKSFVQKGGQ